MKEWRKRNIETYVVERWGRYILLAGKGGNVQAQSQM
jgi:hypothetical protein